MKCTDTRARRLKRAAIYRDAARYLETQYELDRIWGSCWAICHGRESMDAELDAFKAVFGEGKSCGEFWWDFSEDGMNARILALCFMAAITERP